MDQKKTGCIAESNSLFTQILAISKRLDSRAGVLNRGEISPMGEILGIQGGNESV